MSCITRCVDVCVVIVGVVWCGVVWCVCERGLNPGFEKKWVVNPLGFWANNSGGARRTLGPWFLAKTFRERTLSPPPPAGLVSKQEDLVYISVVILVAKVLSRSYNKLFRWSLLASPVYYVGAPKLSAMFWQLEARTNKNELKTKLNMLCTNLNMLCTNVLIVPKKGYYLNRIAITTWYDFFLIITNNFWVILDVICWSHKISLDVIFLIT